MIQPTSSSLTTQTYSTVGTSGQSPVVTEEEAFRQWQTRRDSARQMMRRLSRREQQVVSLVSQGHANKSIAQQLEISVKTIEKHRANATRKLGVNSTADLVRITVLADQDFLVNANRVRQERSLRSPEVRLLEN